MPIDPLKLENEGEVERYLNDMLENEQYRSEAEIKRRANILVPDRDLRAGFVTRGLQMLGLPTADLTREQTTFLKNLTDREITIEGNYDHRRLKPLEDMGYVKSRTAGLAAIIYTVTDKGRGVVQKL